jgi:4-diphosphocytidyl-2-C-methyl-D-erythritol kinase
MIFSLPAPAKINLHLHISRVRADGMHELDTSFAFTQACDDLSFRDSDRIEVSCSRRHLAGESNLVHKLLTAFKSRHHVDQGLAVHIEKKIPEQSGLGGGSSDAATALMAANQLWQTRIPMDELIEFAAPFGADIPCFLFGKASLARGVGEKLAPYPGRLPEGILLLAWPGNGLSTAEVFRHFDSRNHALTTSEALDTMRRDPIRPGENDLEISACSLSSHVERLLSFLRRQAGFAWMSGSGSTCAALLDDMAEADSIIMELKQQGLATWMHAGRIIASHPVRIGRY